VGRIGFEECSVGRTVPSWRLVVNDELESIGRFKQFLRIEDKEIFDDLLRQCKHYAPYASTMASVVKEVPLMFSMLFGQHVMIWELEKRLAKLEANQTRPSVVQDSGPGLETLVSTSQQ
jgi:hypothetical protein